MKTILKCTWLTALFAVMLMTGCATSGRYVALKEFNSPRSADENSPLKGHTVCLKPFVSAFDIKDTLMDKATNEPADFTYVSMSREEVKSWADEVHARKATTTKESWVRIGNLRNGFGAVMSHVYALDDPGVWLTDTLKADLQKLGARVVDSTQEGEADLTVGGTIKYFKIDIYMRYWADLVVDVQLKPKAKDAMNRTLHTTASQVAWSASSWEYYQPIRQCQQKFSRLVIDDMEKQLK